MAGPSHADTGTSTSFNVNQEPIIWPVTKVYPLGQHERGLKLRDALGDGQLEEYLIFSPLDREQRAQVGSYFGKRFKAVHDLQCKTPYNPSEELDNSQLRLQRGILTVCTNLYDIKCIFASQAGAEEEVKAVDKARVRSLRPGCVQWDPETLNSDEMYPSFGTCLAASGVDLDAELTFKDYAVESLGDSLWQVTARPTEIVKEVRFVLLLNDEDEPYNGTATLEISSRFGFTTNDGIYRMYSTLSNPG